MAGGMSYSLLHNAKTAPIPLRLRSILLNNKIGLEIHVTCPTSNTKSSSTLLILDGVPEPEKSRDKTGSRSNLLIVRFSENTAIQYTI